MYMYKLIERDGNDNATHLYIGSIDGLIKHLSEKKQAPDYELVSVFSCPSSWKDSVNIDIP